MADAIADICSQGLVPVEEFEQLYVASGLMPSLMRMLVSEPMSGQSGRNGAGAGGAAAVEGGGGGGGVGFSPGASRRQTGESSPATSTAAGGELGADGLHSRPSVARLTIQTSAARTLLALALKHPLQVCAVLCPAPPHTVNIPPHTAHTS